MTNLRKLPRNFLIQEIRKKDKAIHLFCFDCLGGAKRQDCQTENCHLYSFRPWARKEIKKMDYKKD